MRDGGRGLRRVAPGQGPGDAAPARPTSSTPASPTTWAGSARARRSTRSAATTPPAAWWTTSSPTCYADDHVFLIPNAANTAEVVRRLRAAAPARVTVTDEHEAYAVLAVQGPRSAELLAALGLPTEHDYMSFSAASLGRRRADRLPHRLHRRARLRAGRAGRATRSPSGTRSSPPARRSGCAPAGWPPGTRCAPRWATRCTGRTCRLEITPVQARSGWAVGWDKPAFWGRDALLAEKAAGPRAYAARPGGRRPGHPARPA